jgi:protein-disulfide isomerase
MADGHSRSKWQSIVETVALVVVAVAVAWMAIARSAAPVVAPGSGVRVPPPPAPERPLPADPISLEGAQLLGEKTARIGLVMYSDFECPYCARFAQDTFPALEEQYVRTGRVLVAFRQYPLPMHRFAVKAAEAAECAGRQGKFWPFHDQLFADQKTLDVAGLHDRARNLGLDAGIFATCLEGQAATIVQDDRASGELVGIAGTPTFLVGRVLDEGSLKVSQRFSGAKPLREFQSILDRLLASSGAEQAGG